MLRKQVSEYRRSRVHRPTQRSRASMLTTFAGDRRAETVIAEEQDLRNYLQAPYDPFYGAQSARYVTRGVLHAASVGGFPRIGAFALMCSAAVCCAIGATLTIRTAVVRDGLWGAALIWMALFTFMLGALAFALLSRLRGRN